MAGFLVRLVVSALGLWLATKIVPGVEARTFGDLLAAALLLGLANAVVRPILVILTLPISVLTLGLFLLVINGLMILLVTVFLHGFRVHGLGSAILCWIVVALTGWAASAVGADGKSGK